MRVDPAGARDDIFGMDDAPDTGPTVLERAPFGDEEEDQFEFVALTGRGFILDFQQGRDVISLDGLGLTPWDLLPSIQGRDLVLAFDGGEVVLRGAAGVKLTQWDFRY